MKTNSQLKVIIADNHQPSRQSLEVALLQHNDIAKVAHAENGNQVIALLETEFYHIVFIDLLLPQMNGIETTKVIHDRFRKVKVIANVIEANDKMLFEMYDSGAVGYILKSDDLHTIKSAIDKVVEGHYFFADAGNRILEHLREDEIKKKRNSTNNQLSEPEKEVLKHICGEMSLKEIADKMEVSDSKVKYHHSRLLLKSGAKNTAGLVKYAIREGIFKDE